jgi:putative flippase GtrA
MLKYFISALAALVIQLVVVNILAYFFGHAVSLVLIWNLFGIAAGMVCNFLLSHYWTFKDQAFRREKSQ